MRPNLKAAIFSAGLSQRQLARRIGMRENKLSSIVQGWRNPNTNEQDAIVRELGRSARTLFRRAKDKLAKEEPVR